MATANFQQLCCAFPPPPGVGVGWQGGDGLRQEWRASEVRGSPGLAAQPRPDVLSTPSRRPCLCVCMCVHIYACVHTYTHTPLEPK